MEKVDLSSLSASELKAELKRRESAEKAAEKQAKNDYLAEKELFINATIGAFTELNLELSTLKATTIDRGSELYKKMFELEGKEPKAVNSFTIKSENEDYKVTIDRQERLEFNEEAQVHIETIKDIFQKKFEAVSAGMYGILDHMMMKNTKGDYDPKLLTKVRKQVDELDEPELTAAFEKLVDCQRVSGTGRYCRAYKKDKEGKYQDINVQFSSL